MRSTVVPAQITSVEDKIAGNLTFVQVLLLIAAMLIGALLYLVLPPKLHFGSIKIALVSLELIFFASLALRVKGKIVADWLVLLLRFKFRPRIYVFTKNDVTARDIPSREPKKVAKPVAVPAKQPVLAPALSLSEKDQIGQLLDNPALTVRFAIAKKGGIDVSLQPLN